MSSNELKLAVPQPVQSFAARTHVHPAEVIKGVGSRELEGCRAVFVNMPLRESAVPTDIPEGILLLATNLIRNYGVKATIIDLNAYRIKDTLAKQRGLLPVGRHLTDDEALTLITRHLEEHGDPDLVALSGMITTLRWQKKVAAMIRRVLPEVFLVSGNGLATELKTGLFNFIPELDAVAHSEGEDVIVKILYDAKTIQQVGYDNALSSGKLEPYHLGILAGKPRFMYAGDRPRNLDALPFADLELLREDVLGNQLLEMFLGFPLWGAGANNSSATPWRDNEVTPKTQSVSSRGCPYGCRYCYRGAQGERNWGVRSAKHIQEELIDRKQKYNIRFHGFPDDNFAVTSKRIADLVPLIGDLGIKWGTHTRLDEAAGLKPKPGSPGECIFEDPLRVKLMADAGCVYIGFGPESANAKVLEALGKGGFTLKNGFVPIKVNGKIYQFPRSMVDGIRNCHEVGIHANCTWIMGSPTETLGDLKETVAFILWQKEFYAQYGRPPESVNERMFTLTWYPGTEMIHQPKVRTELSRVFGLNFDPVNHEPICDDNFYRYCLELDDATKVLHDSETGEPLNFGEMSTDQFLQAREYIDSGQTLKILDM